MKYLVKFFVVTFSILICTFASAEQKIAYLDMRFVMNNSIAGKGVQDFLQKSLTENQKEFSDKEKELKKEEVDLLAKKTIFTKEEYKNKTDVLRKKVIDYQSQRKNVLEKITEQRAKARKILLEKLDPIVRGYIKENNISLVIDKNSIIAGSSAALDITNTIIENLNKELPSLNID